MDVESPYSGYKRSLLRNEYYDADGSDYHEMGLLREGSSRLATCWKLKNAVSVVLLLLNTILICVVVSSVTTSRGGPSETIVEDRANSKMEPPASVKPADAGTDTAAHSVPSGTAGSAAVAPVPGDDAPAPTVAPVDGGASEAARAYVETMKTVMDASRDPCNDFYEYSCGGWLQQEIPRTDEKISRFYQGGEMAEQNNKVLRDILENGKWPVLHEYWSSCNDMNKIERSGIVELEPLMDVALAVSADLGGPGRSMNMDAFFSNLAVLHAENIPALFTLSIGADAVGDPRMTSGKIMHGRSPYGGPAAISMPTREHYLSPEWAAERESFREHVARMFRLYLDERGGGLGDLRSEEAAAMVVDFETRLAEIIPEFYEGRTNEDQGVTLRQMRENLQWMTPYFIALYKAVDREMPRDNAVIYVDEYLPQLLLLLSDSPVGTIRSYLVYVILRERAPFLKDRFLDEHFSFYGKTLRGMKSAQKRAEFCVDMAGGSNPYALYTRITSVSALLGRYFTDRTFPQSSVESVEEMARKVKMAMHLSWGDVSWLDRSTLFYARKKLEGLRVEIGKPPKPDPLEQLDLKGSFYEINVAIEKYDTGSYLARLGKQYDLGSWDTPEGQASPQSVTAFNMMSPNVVVIPAGIAQQPTFHESFPASINYGGLGQVLGHELTHGFDVSGRQIDMNGFLDTEEDSIGWWTEEADEGFRTVADCISSQYSDFEVQPGLNLIGKRVLGESLADNGGLKAAFNAYRAHVGGDDVGSAQSEIFPGLTNDQLFFLSFGQAWCFASTPAYQKDWVANNPHAYPPFRVEGALANFPMFAEAFSCKPTDRFSRQDDERCETL